MIGEVYFAQAENGPVKVGISRDVPARLAQLQIGMRELMTLLASVPGDRRVEVYFHKLLRPHRITGEWFRPVPEVFAVIEDVKRRGFQCIPPEFRPLPEYVPKPAELDDTLASCRAYMEVIAGEVIRGETVKQFLDRLSRYTGLTARKLKSIWYDNEAAVYASEYLALRELFEAKQADVIHKREALDAANKLLAEVAPTQAEHG